jgi:hypothetical protein
VVDNHLSQKLKLIRIDKFNNLINTETHEPNSSISVETELGILAGAMVPPNDKKKKII